MGRLAGVEEGEMGPGENEERLGEEVVVEDEIELYGLDGVGCRLSGPRVVSKER